MLRLSGLIFIALLISLCSFGQNYHTVAGFFSWKGKLKKQIKGKKLITFDGLAITPDGLDLRTQPAPLEGNKNEHNMWGGFYSLQIEVSYSGNSLVSCKNDSAGNRTEIVQLVTTKLNGIIKNGTCISVTGAYDKSNNFVCRKIVDATTRVILVNW